MNIEGGDSESKEQEESKFTFKQLDAPFENIMEKETQKDIFKWGLGEGAMQLLQFRFSKSFNLFKTESFLKDFLNSPEVRKALKIGMNLDPVIDEVKYEKLST